MTNQCHFPNNLQTNTAEAFTRTSSFRCPRMWADLNSKQKAYKKGSMESISQDGILSKLIEPCTCMFNHHAQYFKVLMGGWGSFGLMTINKRKSLHLHCCFYNDKTSMGHINLPPYIATKTFGIKSRSNHRLSYHYLVIRKFQNHYIKLRITTQFY